MSAVTTRSTRDVVDVRTATFCFCRLLIGPYLPGFPRAS